MEETKTTTPPSTPAWVEEMHKWQKENPNERAVLCVATDNGNSINTLFGKSLSIKSALTAKENPIAALALMSAHEDSKKKDSPEKEDKPADPSTKDLLKTLLSKLADKL